MAAAVATYCPSRVVEHPKSKSTKPRFASRRVTLYNVTHCRYSKEILEERKKSKKRRGKKGRRSRAPPELIDLADSEISSPEEEENDVAQGRDSSRKL